MVKLQPTTLSLLLAIWTTKAYGWYQPTWQSLDSRPLPQWYDDAKIGIFIHWGVFSVPSFGSEWFWKDWKDSKEKAKFENFMAENYSPRFTYQDFAKDFTAEFFDPVHWTDIFINSGAKYVVLTSKHHEGYTLWPSKYSFGWNSVDVGPRRDLVGELAHTMRSISTVKFGLYHSLFEWYNPLWLNDFKNNFTTNYFVHGKVLPEMKELIEKYMPDVLWSDGEWDAPAWYWNSTEFIAWLYNESPVRDTIVTNDRWGQGTLCKHGDFYTCTDRYNPGVLQSHKWENAMTIDRQSWGFRRDANLSEILTYRDLITEVVSTISCGGNILINVGPTKEGVISPIYEERLRDLGAWLKVTGEAIYGTRPWTYQNETVQTGVWYTKKGSAVYATVLDWPQGNILTLHRPKLAKDNIINVLGYNQNLKWSTTGDAVAIALPDVTKVKVLLPWVLKFSHVTN